MYNPTIKRLLDFTLSVMAITLLAPVFAIICMLIPLDSPGSPFFFQKRIGKGMKPFWLIKFRSMTPPGSGRTGDRQFDPGDDSRVTRIGRLLRKTKLDEIPELINILKGDMSIVGPRPEVPGYVEIYPESFSKILTNRPGLTDPASIRYRNEEALLSRQADPEKYYLLVVLKDKLQLALDYQRNMSFITDVRIMLDTFFCVFMNGGRN